VSIEKSPQLTMSQLYWAAVTQSLASRPLTIIDPQAANRQQIWARRTALNGTASANAVDHPARANSGVISSK